MKKYILTIIVLMSISLSYSQIKVLSGGNVGIGDATPSALLTVGSGDLFQVASTGHTRTIDGTVSSPAFSFTGSTNMGMYKSGTNQLSFSINSAEKMRITTSSFQSLGNYIFSSTFSSITSSAYIRGLNGYSTATTPDYTWYNNDQTGMFHPSSNVIGFSINGSEKVHIHSDGNVGIGDLTPTALFTVGNGDLFQVISTGHTRTIDGTAGSPSFSFTGSTGTGMYKSGTNQLSLSAGGIEKIRIATTEAFRVYQNNTSAALTVDATGVSGQWNFIVREFANDATSKAFVITQNSTDNFLVLGNGTTMIKGWNNSYDFNVNGTAYCTSGSWSASDIRYKKNIVTVADAFNKLNSIRGVHFDYNTLDNPTMNFGQSSAYGVIAQEVEAIFPELVKTDSLGYKAVNYSGLIPILIEAVKEQHQQITQLQNDLNICCSTPKSTQKSMNNGNTNNEDQGGLQNNETKQNVSDYPRLYQNTPNPFNTKTEIKYYVPESSIKSVILIFDMQGKLLKTNNLMNKGNGNLEIFGGELKPGMYMYSLIIDGKEIDTKKMILTE